MPISARTIDSPERQLRIKAYRNRVRFEKVILALFGVFLVSLNVVLIGGSVVLLSVNLYIFLSTGLLGLANVVGIVIPALVLAFAYSVLKRNKQES